MVTAPIDGIATGGILSKTGRSWWCPCGASVVADFLDCPHCGADAPHAETVRNAGKLNRSQFAAWKREVLGATEDDPFRVHDLAALAVACELFPQIDR
jgi:hypothetical protein